MGNRCCCGKNYKPLGIETEDVLAELQRRVVETENDAEKLRALTELGNAYRDQRKFAEAIERYKEALEIAQSVRNELEEARAHAW